MLRPLPRASAPPRSATRLSLAQPEASLVMVLEFFFDTFDGNRLRAVASPGKLRSCCFVTLWCALL